MMKHPYDNTSYYERRETGKQKVISPIDQQKRRKHIGLIKIGGDLENVNDPTLFKNILKIRLLEIKVANIAATGNILIVEFSGLDGRKLNTISPHNIDMATKNSIFIPYDGVSNDINISYDYPRLINCYRTPKDLEGIDVKLKDEDGTKVVFENLYMWFEITYAHW